ncbi:hypothetical protein HHK36_006248 [Tetracentron sinense]|uniref:Glutamyl-tRNA(Gln) amidotransferase subunit C, chloroplastic/mitochondrial n=1 Tax=Tetracentron sinense TaxID=13715 RepID=A0A834ZL70_TETSI|nr:hypothetical protein HHK36_006248 [Tetracentron sinense]
MRMAARALLTVGGGGAPLQQPWFLTQRLVLWRWRWRGSRNYATPSALPPPDLPRLAQTARISLTPLEVEEFAPKIQQVIDWFGQLQAVDLQSIEPALKADTEGDNLRKDLPEIFENREAILDAVPIYEDPYIKVPKVLNKE